MVSRPKRVVPITVSLSFPLVDVEAAVNGPFSRSLGAINR